MRSGFKNMLFALGMCGTSVLLADLLFHFAMNFPEVFILTSLISMCTLEICFFLLVTINFITRFWK